MPKVIFHKNGKIYEHEVKDQANLVVLAGIRKFSNLRYGCGMGTCKKCIVKILAGGEHLSIPTWKEVKVLGEKLQEGYRLPCQFFITDDIEIEQID